MNHVLHPSVMVVLMKFVCLHPFPLFISGLCFGHRRASTEHQDETGTPSALTQVPWTAEPSSKSLSNRLSL